MTVDDTLEESAAEAHELFARDPSTPRPTAPVLTRPLALILGAAVVILGLVGTIHAIEPTRTIARFDLDGERTVPALFTALLLTAGAGVLLGVARRGVGLAAFVLSGFFVLAALDEALVVHERLEREVGVDWQLLYMPAFAVVAVLWFLVLRRLPSRGLYIAGTGAWAVAQLLEKVQWDAEDAPRQGYTAMMISEEVLEMAGSSALLLAFLHTRSKLGSPRASS